MEGKKFNIIIEKGEDGYLLGEILEFRGARTQAKTQDELIQNLKEVMELNLEMQKETDYKFLKFCETSLKKDWDKKCENESWDNM